MTSTTEYKLTSVMVRWGDHVILPKDIHVVDARLSADGLCRILYLEPVKKGRWKK